MIRFLGVMIGSAATLGGMLLLLGNPEFHSGEQVETGMAAPSISDAAAASAAEETSPAGLGETTTTQPAPQSAADDQSLPRSATPSPPPPVSTMTSTSNPDQPVGPPLDASPVPEDSTFPTGAEQNWHSFWNPFRSEIAANGFATRLTRVTGIDYRVLRLKPGSYQVAFAYADDDERRTKIAQIEQSTGLELPEDSL